MTVLGDNLAVMMQDRSPPMTAGALSRCALLDAISLSVLARAREQEALRGRLLFLEGRAISERDGECVCLDRGASAGVAHVGQNRIVLDDARDSVLDFELSSWAADEGHLLRGRALPSEGHDVTVLAIHDIDAPAPQGLSPNTGFLTILGGTGCFEGANGIARFAALYELCEGNPGAAGARMRTVFTLDWVHWRRIPAAGGFS